MKVNRWVSAQNKEVRVYATIETDGGLIKEGCKFASGNHFQAKSSIDDGMTAEEWAFVRSVSYYADPNGAVRWHNMTALRTPVASAIAHKSTRSFCPDCGAEDTYGPCGCDY